MRMRWIAARGVVMFPVLLLTFALSAPGDVSQDPPPSNPPAKPENPAPTPAAAATDDKDKKSAAPSELAAADATDLAELTALKKASVARVKDLEESTKRDDKGKELDKEKAAHAKALGDLLKERLRTLDELETITNDRKKTAAPATNPDQDGAELKTAIKRVQETLKRAEKDADILLPDSFRSGPAKAAPDKSHDEHEEKGKDKDALVNQMKAALAAAQSTAKEQKDALDAAKSNLTAKSGRVAARQGDRESSRKRLVTLAAAKSELDASVAKAPTPEARELIRERAVNIEWEAKLETEKLRDAEGRISLETRRAAWRDLDVSLKQAQVEVAKLTVARLQKCYQTQVDGRQRDLEKLAADNKLKAAAANDPIERYRAKRIVDLATLHSLMLKEDQESTNPPEVSAEEQRGLLERELADFTSLQALVGDRRNTNVIANRMNLTFRRVSSRRARLVRADLVAVSNLATRYETSLTDVELGQLNDGSENREAVQALLESLPPGRRNDALLVSDRLELKYQEYLEGRRKALVILADRAEAAREQMTARLKLMDEELAYLRTHIFWIRDSVPLGPAALAQISLEGRRLLLAAADIVEDLTTRARWSAMSGEFVLAIVGVLTLPVLLHLARSWMRRRLKAASSVSPSLGAVIRSILLHVGVSSLWPLYVFLWAYAARMAPWPRSTARPVAFADGVLAGALFIAALARFAFGPGGFAEGLLRIPTPCARQIRIAIWTLTGAALVFLLPDWLLQRGLIIFDARPVSSPVLGRMFLLTYEIVAWLILFGLVRQKSPLIVWISERDEPKNWVARHRRLVAWSLLAAVGCVIGLDVCGYDFTARRVTSAGLQSLALLAVCGLIYWLLLRSIENHAWRWIRASLHSASDPGLDPSHPDDLAARLRRLAAWIVPIAGVTAGCWVWNIDLALFQSIGDLRFYPDSQLKVGDVTTASLIFSLTIAAWRHMGALFAIAVFPRLPDDQGLRFAVLTLCRYLVLGVGSLAGLSAVHLGWAQIQFVMAALGVGLGFGLQEILSNFVSGIILLVERPIRVGDIVTVAGMSGKVERINIRATTITNAENQSMIVPNREFITSNLVNWTHKDRVVRLSIELGVAYGNDPDTVSELLLTIAREDPDVLRNPLPTALMQVFGTSSLGFALHVFVPDPSLSGRVKHRLCREIQARFQAAGVEIPLPAHEVHVRGADGDHALTDVLSAGRSSRRIDSAHLIAPPPHAIPIAIPSPAEDCHRGVDE
jgi:small-conductance mechanosensitive channel